MNIDGVNLYGRIELINANRILKYFKSGNNNVFKYYKSTTNKSQIHKIV